MSKIIEITKCSDCPHYNEWFDNGKCFMLDKKTDLDTIPDDCPLEDSKVFAHSVMMRPMHEFNGMMVDDIYSETTKRHINILAANDGNWMFDKVLADVRAFIYSEIEKTPGYIKKALDKMTQKEIEDLADEFLDNKMVDDVNITPPIFEDLDYEVDKEMRREFGKDTVTIKEWHEKCYKNRRYHEDMLNKVFIKDGIKEPSYDNSVTGSKSSDKY